MKKPIIDENSPDYVSVWTAPNGCSNCKYCAMDMDMDPFCTHPAVEKSYQAGLSIGTAIELFCGNPHTLWRKR
jgi:hypothetical protein